MKVSKEYEHRLGQGTYLSDLHSSIFLAIPSMMEDLDQAGGRAIGAQPYVNMEAFNPTVFPDGEGRRLRRGVLRGHAPRGAARGQAVYLDEEYKYEGEYKEEEWGEEQSS